MSNRERLGVVTAGAFNLGLTVRLDPDDHYLDAVTERERRADSASLGSVLCPRVVAVIGASRRDGTIEQAILRRIADGGFLGRLFAVNPHATEIAPMEIAGVPAYASVAALPEVPDLAVVCVPAPAVPGVAEDCGRGGVRALLVRQRTSAVNAMRGLLSEFGIVAAKGIRRVEELRQRMSRTGPDLLPDAAREAIGVLCDHLDGLQERAAKIEARINALCIHIERYRRDIYVSCALAVAKKCPFDALCSGQQAQLGTSDTCSAIIVSV